MRHFREPPDLPGELIEYILVLTAALLIKDAIGISAKEDVFDALCGTYPEFISRASFRRHNCILPAVYFTGNYESDRWTWTYYPGPVCEGREDLEIVPDLVFQRVPSDRKDWRPTRTKPPRCRRKKNKERPLRYSHDD